MFGCNFLIMPPASRVWHLLTSQTGHWIATGRWFLYRFLQGFIHFIRVSMGLNWFFLQDFIGLCRSLNGFSVVLRFPKFCPVTIQWPDKRILGDIPCLQLPKKMTYASEKPAVSKMTSGKKNGKEERNTSGKVLSAEN